MTCPTRKTGSAATMNIDEHMNLGTFVSEVKRSRASHEDRNVPRFAAR